MSNDLIQLLQREITPDISGLFWISTESLKDKPRPFYALDYLFDGLLTKSINDHVESPQNLEKNNFFYTTSYGNPFFLFQLFQKDTDEEKLIDQVTNILNLVNNRVEKDKSILIIDKPGSSSHKFIKNKFSKFSFRVIEIN